MPCLPPRCALSCPGKFGGFFPILRGQDVSPVGSAAVFFGWPPAFQNHGHATGLVQFRCWCPSLPQDQQHRTVRVGWPPRQRIWNQNSTLGWTLGWENVHMGSHRHCRYLSDNLSDPLCKMSWHPSKPNAVKYAAKFDHQFAKGDQL